MRGKGAKGLDQTNPWISFSYFKGKEQGGRGRERERGGLLVGIAPSQHYVAPSLPTPSHKITQNSAPLVTHQK